jgi:hypothetical protein
MTKTEKVISILMLLTTTVWVGGFITLFVGAALHNGNVFWPGFFAAIVGFMLFTAVISIET